MVESYKLFFVQDIDIRNIDVSIILKFIFFTKTYNKEYWNKMYKNLYVRKNNDMHHITYDFVLYIFSSIKVSNKRYGIYSEQFNIKHNYMIDTRL